MRVRTSYFLKQGRHLKEVVQDAMALHLGESIKL